MANENILQVAAKGDEHAHDKESGRGEGEEEAEADEEVGQGQEEGRGAHGKRGPGIERKGPRDRPALQEGRERPEERGMH